MWTKDVSRPVVLGFCTCGLNVIRGLFRYHLVFEREDHDAPNMRSRSDSQFLISATLI